MRMTYRLLFLMALFARGAIAETSLLTSPESFYASEEAKRIAENLLVYQLENGGWPKNYDWKKTLSEGDKRHIIAQKSNIEESTFDNRATYTEIMYLARIYTATKEGLYKEAILKGVEFILKSQYANGGFPQFPCRKKGYYLQITYNDGAMIGVLNLLKQISEGRLLADISDATLRERCAKAVTSGITCILQTQIRVDGNLGLWCAQHDKNSLQPVMARSYELPSLSGSESVGIVRFLMGIEKPSKEIIASIEGAMDCFERLKIKGIRLENRDLSEGKKDCVVVADPEAKPMWARFYDLKTLKPIFCSRDGVPREKLEDISYERRNGYSWLGYYATTLLEKDYPAWKSRVMGEATRK